MISVFDLVSQEPFLKLNLPLICFLLFSFSTPIFLNYLAISNCQVSLAVLIAQVVVSDTMKFPR